MTILSCGCSPAQFAEETRRADRRVPRGIVISTLLNFTFGLGYIVVILFCLPVRLRPSSQAPKSRAVSCAISLREGAIASAAWAPGPYWAAEAVAGHVLGRTSVL